MMVQGSKPLSYKQQFVLKKALTDKFDWTEANGMKRPHWWQFWLKNKWQKELNYCKTQVAEILKESGIDS